MKKKTQFLLVSLQLSTRYFFTIITALLETFVLAGSLCKKSHNDIIVYFIDSTPFLQVTTTILY